MKTRQYGYNELRWHFHSTRGMTHLNEACTVRELARTFTDVGRYGEAEPLWLELVQWVAALADDPDFL